jgi:hypothetical protein
VLPVQKERFLDVASERGGDPLLDRILAARSATEREAAVAELLAEHAYERIGKILTARFKRARMDLDQLADLRHDVIVRLVSRLRRLTAADESPIESFPDYVAMVTFNAFEDLVRRRYPLRAKLRNRTLYFLTHDAALAVWTHAGVSVCGLAAWRGQAPDEVTPMPPVVVTGERNDLRPELRSLLARAGAPRTVEDVVTMLAAATGIPRNETPQPLDDAVQLRSETADPAEELIQLQRLRVLWREILQLPVRQRIALLLQAHDPDGESVMHLIAAAGVATIRDLARALEMSDEELTGMWLHLPATDLTIGKRLGVVRQQVINLRRAARARLMRKMRTAEKGRPE